MEIIPVIDIRGGVAVRAVAGNRSAYQPLATPLAARADPVDVAKGYCALFPFKTIYVADLDGIEGHGSQNAVVRRVAAAVGGVDLWVDDGAAVPDKSLPRTPVIGSESMTSASSIEEGQRNGVPCVLSLDFRDDEFLGPKEVLERYDAWPERIIVMTLARVGCGGGPDVDRVSQIVRRARGRRVYAAGGVRDLADLRAIREAGACGALVATALHDGKIKAGDLREIAGL